MAPLSPASGVPETSPATCRRRTQRAALTAARQEPVSPNAHAARPVLLVLLASVPTPPPKEPFFFWVPNSQSVALSTAARTRLPCLGRALSATTASAVTSVSGADTAAP